MNTNIPVSKLRQNTIATIDNIAPDVNRTVQKRLMDMGVIPNRTLQLKKKYGDMFVIKVEADNPIAIRKELANNILVKSPVTDVFENSSQQAKNTLWSKIKKLFN